MKTCAGCRHAVSLHGLGLDTPLMASWEQCPLPLLNTGIPVSTPRWWPTRRPSLPPCWRHPHPLRPPEPLHQTCRALLLQPGATPGSPSSPLPSAAAPGRPPQRAQPASPPPPPAHPYPPAPSVLTVGPDVMMVLLSWNSSNGDTCQAMEVRLAKRQRKLL